MSSILDALRKLEEEKAQHPSAPETPLPIEPPAREPAPRRARRSSRNRTHDHGRKLWVAVPVAIFAMGVIWAAVTNGPPSESNEQNLLAAANPVDSTDPTGAMARRDPSLERLEADLRDVAETPAQSTAAAVPETNVTEAIGFAEPEPEEAFPPKPAVSEPDRSRAANEIVAARTEPIRVDVKPVPMESEPELAPAPEPPVEEFVPDPVEIEPVRQQPVEEAPTLPRAEPSERYQRAMAVSNAMIGETVEEPEPALVERDIRKYNIMTRTERARLGVPDLVLNVLGPPNERHPQGFALINYNNVYVGETIPETQGRAQLIGVDLRGIAIDVGGERFYYPK